MTEDDRKDFVLANMFASKGLRTLAFGFRELVNPSSSGSMSEDCYIQTEVEKEFRMLGVTAVEDLLQENVDQCIREFRQAGIKVWMLTGDKGETAKEISLSCGLYDEHSTLVEIKEDTDEEAADSIR